MIANVMPILVLSQVRVRQPLCKHQFMLSTWSLCRRNLDPHHQAEVEPFNSLSQYRAEHRGCRGLQLAWSQEGAG